MLVRKEEFRNTKIVPFGPVQIRLLADAETTLKRTFGWNCLNELRVSHIVHHSNMMQLAKKTRLPLYFPDDEPVYRQPAGWDEGLFAATNETQGSRH